MHDIENIINKYEIPVSLYPALWDAYEAGLKRGFIDASITAFNQADAL